MGLSFQEKSLWLLFASLVVSFGLYFVTVLPADTTNVLPHQVGVFVLVLVLLVVVQVIGHVVVTLVDRRSETDERDQLIALKSTRVASYVLATGVFLALCTALLTEGNFLFTHVLLGFWVLAQLVEIGTQSGEMTQADLGDRVGVTRQTINAIEANKYSPSLEVAFRIAYVFGVPLERVFQYTESAK